MDNSIKSIDEWEVLTPTGWSSFSGIKKLSKPYSYRISFGTGILRGSANHRIKMEGEYFKYLSEILEGDRLHTGEVVVDVERIDEEVPLFDLLDVEADNVYFTNGIVSHNCAFIDTIAETYASAQQTLATGGQCIALSTPNGVGNWFHQTWENAEAGENSFIPIRLPWTVHPERDQTWRDQQDADLGVRFAAQECECSFLSSGDTFFEPTDLTYYEETYLSDPMEKRGVDGNLWIWESPDYATSYMIVADVARGDASDNSTFHILNIETCTQIGEYRGKISPKDFGNLLVGIASEYNGALLVVENANIGWATIEQILEREYPNLYYSSRNSSETVESYMNKFERDQLVPGFITSMKTRPLLLAKLQEYVTERSITIQSKRTLSEMRVFVWKSGKAQAQTGYNDDLVMALAIGMYVRDTALRLRQQGVDLTKAQLSSLSSMNSRTSPVVQTYTPTNNPFQMNVGGSNEDISWLLR